MNICGLMLAAGGSSRLGKPKQLISLKGKPLIHNSIESAFKTSLTDVFVVLGAHFEKVSTAICHLPVKIIRNWQWQEGIGSSIRIGVEYISKLEKYDAVMIMLCDQLHVNAQHLQSLVKKYHLKEGLIIATSYSNQAGVPAVVDKLYFPELIKLSGDTGAKKIFLQHPHAVVAVNFEQAGIDIDTPEDLFKAGLH